MTKLIAVFILAALTLSGCAVNGGRDTGEAVAYKKISPEEAKAVMDSQEEHIILDVRTPAEYEQGHIKNALLIPDTELGERAESELPNKDVKILVYCRSGRRSAAAAKALAEKGYTAVLDFGGITDWPYDIE